MVTCLDIQNAAAAALLVLTTLAAKRAADVARYDDVIIARMKVDTTSAAQGGQLLVSLSNLSEVGIPLVSKCVNVIA